MLELSRRGRARAADALPMYMDPIEQSQLLAILHALGPEQCLEWGSGGSTRAILERCPEIRRLVSVEHAPGWAESVAARVKDPRLSLHSVAPNRPLSPGAHTEDEVIAWEATGETDPEVFRDYVELPARLGLEFDFVLVDGRARCYCLQQGFELLKPGGVIVLHDAQREQYHEALRGLGRPVFLEPWRQGQIALVRKPSWAFMCR